MKGKSSQVSITQVISRNSVDNPIFPTMGSSVSLSIQMSGGPLLPGTIDFHKWVFSSEWYVPLFGSSRMALYLSMQYGYIGHSTGNRLFSPWISSLWGGRGWATSPQPRCAAMKTSLSVRATPAGRLSAGRRWRSKRWKLRFALAVNPIPIYLLAFVEGGNVYESFARADFFDLKRSAGLGARLLINPIGMIGFDYGYGFDDVFPRDGRPDGWRFHFVFGKGF